ncbi:GNAT family N-acetyltransferase [Shewanella sp. NKUCC06_TVS]|uniref:GNAT family N-acetyltransferase n=1 Tax=Shewanella sp. NKUCC06_TVS TaxID=2842128 RepID=UPI001C5A97D0|nr:GNAT family N-acetyltransferase [Shewanella sp. NKUCC06_TVS]MBW3530951.1 GNAT family N-acetyltransferase [Shewanella sp. NKUCC06_TVS]
MLVSKSIRIRLVEESDAAFILSLRLDDNYNQFLSKVSADLDAQRDWITEYKKDEVGGKQFYFIIEKLDGTACGTVRVYDLREDSFCWGSWILNEKKTRYAAIESALLVYEFGFRHLNLNNSHFEVMKENCKVISFHEKFGAKCIAEDSNNFYFTINKKDVADSFERFKALVL